MQQQRKLPGILIYLLILFFSVIGFVYALNTATNEQQIIETGGKSGPQDGVTISKVISKTDTENFFDITLTVETTSEIKNITTYPDLAVVIVMDISNTMNFNVDDGTTSRYEGAVAASKTFIEKFKTESDKSLAKREIGFVAFNTNTHKIFGLQECTSTDCKDETKNNRELSKIMSDDTSSIIKADGYGEKRTRFTNIEGGLKMAHDMLKESSASNKYIILLSDGMPTTYLKSTTTYEGYEPYSAGKVGSSEGVFGYTPKKWGCNYGTSYSDRGAQKAREEATRIKNNNIDIMVVGTGINSENFETIQDYLDHENGKKNEFSVVDSEVDGSEGNEFEIGAADDKDSYVNWLTKKIASDNQYYNSDESSIKEVFNEIFKEIQEQLKTSTEASWVANDPMGAMVGSEKIEFIGFYDDATPSILHESLNDYNSDGTNNTTQSDTASFKNSTAVINWDLKNSTYDSKRTETTTNGEITYYKYILKYRIRLKNEINQFEENHEYKTNGTTSLTYAVLQSNGVLSENKTLVFKEPSVKGYLGEFSFIKYSSYGNRVMEGVKFKLVHNPNCTRHQGFQNMTEKTVTIPDMVATSDENGLVTFTNIPSGHDYILKEVEAPADHDKAEDVEIIVAYDKVYKAPDDNGVVNKIKTGSLEIKKQVEGNDKYAGTFEFELEIKFNGNALTDGPYKYVIKDSDGKEIKSGEQNFKGKTTISLKKDQTYTIEGLPVGATYTLKEITTNGYKVQYQINDKDIQTGDTAKCNSSNSCRIEKGSNNTIVFINTAGYILPATGKSGMLILIIIASLLIIGPIIDIGYMLYKNRKEDKLTS